MGFFRRMLLLQASSWVSSSPSPQDAKHLETSAGPSLMEQPLEDVAQELSVDHGHQMVLPGMEVLHGIVSPRQRSLPVELATMMQKLDCALMDFIAAVVSALPPAQHQHQPQPQQQLQQQPGLQLQQLQLQQLQLQQQPQQQLQLQPQPRQQLPPQPQQQNNVLPKAEKLVIHRELLDMTQQSCVVNPIHVKPFSLALENVQEQIFQKDLNAGVKHIAKENVHPDYHVSITNAQYLQIILLVWKLE